MRILSCNIRYSPAPDGDNRWPFRRDLALRVVAGLQPDLVCFQEMRADQFHDFQEGLSGFTSFEAADEPGGRSPVNAIFYRRERYDRISAGAYWLSETPHVPGSRSWESACVRLCNWVCLLDRQTAREIRVANTHLDHISQTARERQAALINQDASAYAANYPQVLTGDMNANSSNPALRAFFRSGWRDSYAEIHGELEPGNTFHQFLGPAYTGNDGKIDWILYRGALRPAAAEIVKTSENGRYPSDHYFIQADFDWI